MPAAILKRCGIVLIVVGAADIAWMIWALSHGMSYSSSFNIFAIVAGIFLIRGSLRAARWVAMLASFMLATFAALFVTMPFLFPLGYWRAVFRSGHGAVLAGVALPLLILLFWIRHELLRPEIARAQAEGGLPRPRTVLPLVAGLLLPLGLVTVLVLALHGETAREAVRRAQLQMGDQYDYVVTSMQLHSSHTGKAVSALVCAYNDSELKTIEISWKE